MTYSTHPKSQLPINSKHPYPPWSVTQINNPHPQLVQSRELLEMMNIEIFPVYEDCGQDN